MLMSASLCRLPYCSGLFAQFYNFCKGYPLKDKTLPPVLTERIIALAKEVRQAGSEALIVTGTT